MNNVKAKAAALCLATLLPGSYALAQDLTLGAQGCMAMNLGVSQSMRWNSEGLTNGDTEPRWVVCPIPLDTFDSNVDVIARIRNRSDQTADVQCLWKTTQPDGDPKKSFSLTETLAPGFWVAMGYSNINFLAGDSLSVSCLLPSEFSITSFYVELQGGD